MKVPLLDLKPQYQTIKEEILRTAEEIFESQYFILGPRVEALEKEVAEYCHTTYAVGVSSGTDALLLSLMAANIGPNDLVLTSPYTFFATAGSIARSGAVPVFVDVDPETYNISVESLETTVASMPKAQRRRLKGIIPVHLYGQCADMDPVLAVARAYDLVVVEDAAQAIGAEYNGRRAGSMGDAGCFSFFPSKNLGAFGDAGIVTTNSESLYHQMVQLRVHGSHRKYYHMKIGGNFRLDALQAGILSIKLKRLDEWTRGRQENAALYRTLFSQAGLSEIIRLPVAKEERHIYNQFVIRVPDRRDELLQYLHASEIGCEVYYPVPLHLQTCFGYLQYQTGDFPVSEDAAMHTLALPIYSEITHDQQAYVVEKIKSFYL
jgi:dTDP-4-amino-4,6-dideoxygalactose transaminase